VEEDEDFFGMYTPIFFSVCTHRFFRCVYTEHYSSARGTREDEEEDPALLPKELA